MRCRDYHAVCLGLLAVAVLLIVAPLASHAEDDNTFRGLRFGVDIRAQVPECAKCKDMIVGTTDYCATKALRKQKSPPPACWKQAADMKDVSLGIEFVDALDKDYMLTEGTVWLTDQIDGKLTDVVFECCGESHFDDLVQLVSDRFGKATIVSATELAGQFATWNGPNLHVSLYSNLPGHNRGLLEVETKASVDKKARDREEKTRTHDRIL